MDKLRAIQYFNRAAEIGSFAGTARYFGVSTPAVTQLIRTLERSLGVTLLYRAPHGLALTAEGERYYEVSRKLADELHDIEQRLGPGGPRLRGALSVGMHSSLGQNCVMPRIRRFLVQYPEIELVLKPIVTFAEMEEKNLDLAVLVGWPPERDLIVKPLAQTRLVVCAAPEYWAREGMPGDPEELQRHSCLALRSSGGTLLDRWSFARGAERRVVDVKTRFFSDDRGWLAEVACAGGGIVRMGDFVLSRYLSHGLLVPALTDWEALEAPQVFAAYPPSLRRSKPLRAFLDFLVEVFRELERERPQPIKPMPRAPKPDWFGRAQGRHSRYVERKKRAG